MEQKSVVGEVVPELLPCPFCGGAAEYMLPESPEVRLVSCPNRQCPMNRPLSMNRKLWNTRAALPVDSQPADSKHLLCDLCTAGDHSRHSDNDYRERETDPTSNRVIDCECEHGFAPVPPTQPVSEDK